MQEYFLINIVKSVLLWKQNPRQKCKRKKQITYKCNEYRCKKILNKILVHEIQQYYI